MLSTLLLVGIQLASSPHVTSADADPRRNLLWDDDSISDSFIIGLGALLLAFALLCLTVLSWLVYLLLVREFPTHPGKLGRSLLFGVLGSVAGMVLTYYASLRAFSVACVAGFLIAGTLVGFFTSRHAHPAE